MKKNFKIKAFTILELVVVMLLSSLAVGIFYTGFELVSAQHIKFKNTQVGALETSRLDHALSYAWGEAHSVLRINSHELKFDIDETKSVNFDFKHNMVIRRVETLVDTFDVQIGPIEFMLNGENQGGLAALVDQVNISVNPEEGEQQLVYFRRYGNARLMELEN